MLMERLLRALAALVAKRTNDDGVVRAYVLQQVDPILCRVVYAAVLEGEADDALTFRSESNSQALCLHLKEPVLMRVSALPTADRRRAATKYLHAARPADITHVYCVPIFPSHDAWNLPLPSDRPIPVAGICFDFRSSQNEALLLEPDIEDLLAAMGADGRRVLERDAFLRSRRTARAGGRCSRRLDHAPISTRLLHFRSQAEGSSCRSCIVRAR